MNQQERGQRLKEAKLEALRVRRRASRVSAGRSAGRTIGLAALLVVLAFAWLVREFQLDMDELLGFLGVSALFVLGAAVCGIAGFVLLWLMKGRRR